MYHGAAENDIDQNYHGENKVSRNSEATILMSKRVPRHSMKRSMPIRPVKMRATQGREIRCFMLIHLKKSKMTNINVMIKLSSSPKPVIISLIPYWRRKMRRKYLFNIGVINISREPSAVCRP